MLRQNTKPKPDHFSETISASVYVTAKNEEEKPLESDSELTRATYLTMISACSQLPIFDINWSTAPIQVKLLASHKTAWPPGSVIRYSFTLPKEAASAQKLMQAQPGYVNHSVPLTELPPFAVDYVTLALSWWESMVNLRFIRNDTAYHVPIFQFTHVDNHSELVLGYGQLGQQINPDLNQSAGIGFNRNYLNYANHYDLSSYLYHLTFHETGHTMMSLNHPFNSLDATPTTHQNTTTYSVMAYNSEIDPLSNKSLISITPTPADMDAAQFLFGKNMTTRAGNNTYLLDRFIPVESENATYKAVASLPWDAGGVDTLSAKFITQNVTIDIRKYGKSILPDGYVMMPAIDIENVIGGAGRNIIILNELNNHIDVTASQQTTLWLNPSHSGIDTVKGFNPVRDEIILTSPPAQLPAWKNVEIPCPPGSPYTCSQSAARIEFDQTNSLTLTGVSAEQMQNQTMRVESLEPDASHGYHDTGSFLSYQTMMYEIFDTLPAQLSIDFLNAFQAGAVISFIESLTEETLRAYQYSEATIHLSKRALYALYIIYNCSILANAPGLMTTEFLKSLNFSDTFAHLAGMSVTCGLTLFQNMTPLGIARTAVSLTGGIAGSLFTIWAGRTTHACIKKLTHDPRTQSDPVLPVQAGIQENKPVVNVHN